MLVFRKYSKEARCKSNRVSIYKFSNNFKVVYESYLKTNPSRSQREAGIKPKRLLIDKQEFFFDEIIGVDFTGYIFNGLIAEYLVKNKVKNTLFY